MLRLTVYRVPPPGLERKNQMKQTTKTIPKQVQAVQKFLKPGKRNPLVPDKRPVIGNAEQPDLPDDREND
jgi:hypothetical protein